MLLGELVRTSATVAATRSRLSKRAALATLLRALERNEVEVAVGFLTAKPRQRTGVGWSTSFGAKAPPATAESLTLLDVDRYLTDLEATSGTGSQATKQALVNELFERATSEEQDFLRGLIIGEVRQGALAGVLTDAVAAAAKVDAEPVRRAAMLSGSLAVAADAALFGGAAALDEIRLAVGNPLQPMLASTSVSVAEAIAELVADGDIASVEWKLDGIRIQVHRADDDVCVYTRNLNDVTMRLPDLVATVRSLPSSHFIFDGELIGLREDDAPRLFQDTAGSFATEGAAEWRLRPFFFDCLHADGTDLVDRPLADRQRTIDRIAAEYRLPTLHTTDPETAAAFADEALRAGHEGIMVKSLSSTYEAGRRGKAWRKVKPVRTLDLIVIGAEWGHGRRQGFLSNLHLGARNPDGGSPIMVGKTFKGLTDVLLAWQTEVFQSIESHRTAGAVFVRPELVVEIALDGVQRSTRYPGGVALRFARVKTYRPDKTADDADDIDAVRSLLPDR